ncbi:MAG: C40 family peptidase [Oscillospiraceae bacterium]|nr:C40 family peptidase [Oscillospiraceae bacterium]
MKRILQIAFVLAVCLILLPLMTQKASASELKTAIGTVESNDGLRLREKPDKLSATITIAQGGDTVVILRKVGDWYLVNYNLYIGYMHQNYLIVSERMDVDLGAGAVDADLVSLRSGPADSSPQLYQLERDEQVHILGFANGWYRVMQEETIGYIRSDEIALLEKPVNNTDGVAWVVDENDPTAYSPAGEQIAACARQYLGCAYVYGGESPSGFDCSGFVQYVYAQLGYSIHRTATAQLADGYDVPYDSLLPGDIIYFGYGSTASHVGIYLGNGDFIHAQSSATGVVITALSDPWYASRFLCAHRIAS